MSGYKYLSLKEQDLRRTALNLGRTFNEVKSVIDMAVQGLLSADDVRTYLRLLADRCHEEMVAWEQVEELDRERERFEAEMSRKAGEAE